MPMQRWGPNTRWYCPEVIVVESWSEVRKGELEVACGAWVAQALKVWEPAAHLDIGDVCERASRQYQMPFFADEA
jgi:hypothetical protein